MERGLMYYLQLENLNRVDRRGWSKDSRLYDCGIKTDMPEFLLSLLLLLGTPGRAGPACVCVISSLCYSLSCYWLPFPMAQKGKKTSTESCLNLCG